MSRKWSVIVENQTKEKIKKREVQSFIKTLLKKLDSEYEILETVSEVSVLFCKDDFIWTLNLEYRKKDRPTDVLSFASLDGEDAGFITYSLGDIVISLDTAKRQAVEYKTTYNEEIIRLLTHGILHLIGFDHENVTKKQEKAMLDLQDDLILMFKDNFQII